MGLNQVSLAEIKKKTEEDRGFEHLSWLGRKLYAKTTLTTFMYCREKFRMRYVVRADEYWGLDLIEGIAGHKVLEVYHARHLAGEKFYSAEMREILLTEIRALARRVESSRPLDADGAASRILPLCALYIDNWKTWYDKVLGVEETFGVDKAVQFGGVCVAGHNDARAQERDDVIIVDYKFCGPSSQYRQPVKFDIGMELYKAGFKAKKTALLPIVKGLKSKPRKEKKGQIFTPSGDGMLVIDGLNPIPHSRASKQTAEVLVAHMVDQIEKGNLDGGPPDIGKNLCQPRYCSYFGRCRFTKHLNRRTFK